jgi:hypothetical protein
MMPGSTGVDSWSSMPHCRQASTDGMKPNDVCYGVDAKEEGIPVGDRPACITSNYIFYRIYYIVFIVINQDR